MHSNANVQTTLRDSFAGQAERLASGASHQAMNLTLVGVTRPDDPPMNAQEAGV